MRFAKYIDETHIEQVTHVRGVPNFWQHPSIMKKLGIYELIDDTEDREGYDKEWTSYSLQPDTIHIIASTYTKQPAPSIVISKGDFIEALIKTNLYDTVKNIYENDTDMQIFFAGFQYIDLDYTLTHYFIKKYPQVFTEENIEAIIQEITSPKSI